MSSAHKHATTEVTSAVGVLGYDRGGVVPGKPFMRWLFVAFSLAGVVLAVWTRSPGWFALAVVVAAVSALAAALAFANERIVGHSREQELNEFEIEQLRKAMRQQANARSKESDGKPGIHDR